MYTPGPIPAEPGKLANLTDIYLCTNQLTGTPSLFPLTCIQYEEIGGWCPVLVGLGILFVVNLPVLCIPQVPFRLNWANVWIWRICVYPQTRLLVLSPLFLLDMRSVRRKRLAFHMPFPRSRTGWQVYCMFWPIFQSDFRVTCVLFRILTAFCGIVSLLFACMYRRSKASVASKTPGLQHFHLPRLKRRRRRRQGPRPRPRRRRRRKPDQDQVRDQNSSSKQSKRQT